MQCKRILKLLSLLPNPKFGWSACKLYRSKATYTTQGNHFLISNLKSQLIFFIYDEVWNLFFIIYALFHGLCIALLNPTHFKNSKTPSRVFGKLLFTAWLENNLLHFCILLFMRFFSWYCFSFGEIILFLCTSTITKNLFLLCKHHFKIQIGLREAFVMWY